MTKIRYLLSLIFMLLSIQLFSQIDGVFTIEEDMMVLKLQKNFSKVQADSIRKMVALPTLSIDSIFKYKTVGSLSKEGWRIRSINETNVVLVRSLKEMSNSVDWSKNAILLSTVIRTNHNLAGTPGYPKDVAYGRNKFKSKVTVRQRIAGIALFWLPEFLGAKKVYLSGNFNDWSPYATPMTKTDSGWVSQLKLEPGKYFYKYIVDGNWTEDNYNELRENDGAGGNNSTYYQTNFTFTLKGYKNADRIMLAGSFNNWDQNELRMLPYSEGWLANMYLQDGVHTYKFVVDGKWITDPANKWTRPDGEGNFNSVVGSGDTVTFKLKGFASARQIIVSGSFNNWRTNELVMVKTIDGWKLNYMLAPGNYEYKFIVDGNWITDPDNFFTSGGGDTKNSVLSVKPNFVFRLKKYPEAKEVLVTGSFNEWAEPGYKMQFINGQWNFPLHLKPGKYTYKFVVNGKWILDPENKTWEENEFRTNNSVLWMER